MYTSDVALLCNTNYDTVKFAKSLSKYRKMDHILDKGLNHFRYNGILLYQNASQVLNSQLFSTRWTPYTASL